MRVRLTVILVVALHASPIAAAQDKLCDPAKASAVNRSAGVAVQAVTLSGKWGSNSATIYLPDKQIAEGVVVLSHSAIQSATGTSVDLLPFALTLAPSRRSRHRPQSYVDLAPDHHNDQS